jgi:DNA-directed RNA polymerase I, II, and III subunit RPABC2
MSNKMKKSNKKNIDDEKTSDESESEIESEISEALNDIDLNDFDDNDNDNDDEGEGEGDDDDYDNIDETELKKEIGIENGDEDIFDCFYDIEHSEVNNVQKNDVPKEDRITMPYLTKYERVRVLGTRAKQISLGAKILVNNIDLTTKSHIEIATIELELGVIPFKIRRPLPNGQVEEWKISELIEKV